MRSWEEERAVELVLDDGDYVRNGTGGLRTAERSDALLQRVLWKLTVRRGSFPFLPQLGSRLYLLPREKPSARRGAARFSVDEALAGEEGLSVTSVELSEGESGAIGLTVELEYGGETLRGSLTVNG